MTTQTDTLDLARRLLALHQAALNAEENGRSSDVAAMDALVAWNRFEDALTAAPALAQYALAASAEIERLKEAVRVAEQLAVIASDWNLDEVEVDGEMRSIYDVRDIFRTALKES